MSPTDRFKLSLPFNITLEAAGSVARKLAPMLAVCFLVLGGLYFIVEYKLARRLDKVETSQTAMQSDITAMHSDLGEIKTALYTGRVKVLSQGPQPKHTLLAARP